MLFTFQDNSSNFIKGRETKVLFASAVGPAAKGWLSFSAATGDGPCFTGFHGNPNLYDGFTTGLHGNPNLYDGFTIGLHGNPNLYYGFTIGFHGSLNLYYGFTTGPLAEAIAVWFGLIFAWGRVICLPSFRPNGQENHIEPQPGTIGLAGLTVGL